MIMAQSLRIAHSRLLQVWFRLFQRHRYGRLVLEEVAGTPILVLPQVFNPKLFRSGEFLVQCLGSKVIPPGSTVLDMGTGSGVGAVFAARWAGRVVAVDLNPEAVRCARINALMHRLEGKIEVRLGDLFTPVAGERFDLVLFNPPYFRGEPSGALDRAWRSNDVVERFATGLRSALLPSGHALVVLSSQGDISGALAAFQGHGLKVATLAKRDLINEVLTVYRLSAGS
jgi:release factor glutamine methyltransferase